MKFGEGDDARRLKREPRGRGLRCSRRSALRLHFDDVGARLIDVDDEFVADFSGERFDAFALHFPRRPHKGKA
jgi:hypothetical protein